MNTVEVNSILKIDESEMIWLKTLAMKQKIFVYYLVLHNKLSVA